MKYRLIRLLSNHELDIPDSITRPVEDEDNDFSQPIVQM